MEIVAVVMAGGRGERFWPLSRSGRPKQFLRLAGTRTMLQDTIERLAPLVPPDRTLVVTGEPLAAAVRKQVPALPPDNVIIEPMGKDTAPCIGLATLVVMHRFGPDTPMVVLPADHLIREAEGFRRTLALAVTVAERLAGLVTIGISPSRPETGYGYIEYGDPLDDPLTDPEGRCCRVVKFTEKPDRKTALRFLDSGRYLWNSGMFAWKPTAIWEALRRFLPPLHAGLERLNSCPDGLADRARLREEFAAFPRISIDYGVMEKADNVYVVRGDFGWDDVGTWGALARIFPADEQGNVVRVNGEVPVVPGRVALRGTRGCIIHSSGRLVAAVGVQDLIVVETDDAVLICHREKEQEVKELLAGLRGNGFDDWL